MAYVEFPKSQQGNIDRKNFWTQSDEGLLLISQWRREGITCEEIALKYIGIGTSTWDRWRKSSDKLCKALSTSDQVVNASVEQALLKRALGYDVEEVTEELVEGTLRITKRQTKHIAPDVKACLSWLYSRRSDRWRVVQDPLDSTADEVNAAKKMLVTIKQVAENVKTNQGTHES